MNGCINHGKNSIIFHKGFLDVSKRRHVTNWEFKDRLHSGGRSALIGYDIILRKSHL